jgi:hypothetical protein
MSAGVASRRAVVTAVGLLIGLFGLSDGSVAVRMRAKVQPMLRLGQTIARANVMDFVISVRLSVRVHTVIGHLCFLRIVPRTIHEQYGLPSSGFLLCREHEFHDRNPKTCRLTVSAILLRGWKGGANRTARQSGEWQTAYCPNLARFSRSQV